MEILARNKFLVVLGSVVLAATILLIILIAKSLSDFKEAAQTVQKYTDDESTFNRRKYKLDRTNFEIAERNELAVSTALKQLNLDIADSYDTIDFSDHDKQPVRFKEELRNSTDVFSKVLSLNNVTMPGGFQQFGFADYMRSEVIPSHDQIAAVSKQLQIYDEFVEIIHTSGIQRVNLWKLNSDIWTLQPVVKEVQSENLYSYYSYEFSVTAPVPNLQTFLQNLTNSRYCFVVRWMSTNSSMNSVSIISNQMAANAAAVPGGNVPDVLIAPGPPPRGSGVRTGPGGRPIGGPGAPGPGTRPPEVEPDLPVATNTSKADRVIFTDFASVTMDIAVLYVEFKGKD